MNIILLFYFLGVSQTSYYKSLLSSRIGGGMNENFILMRYALLLIGLQLFCLIVLIAFLKNNLVYYHLTHSRHSGYYYIIVIIITC